MLTDALLQLRPEKCSLALKTNAVQKGKISLQDIKT